MSKFILQLSEAKKELNLDKRVTFFKFEISVDDYELLIQEYGKAETDRALYRLDRLLLTNKQQCPNNIRKYIDGKLKKKKNKECRKNERRKEK